MTYYNNNISLAFESSQPSSYFKRFYFVSVCVCFSSAYMFASAKETLFSIDCLYYYLFNVLFGMRASKPMCFWYFIELEWDMIVVDCRIAYIFQWKMDFGRRKKKIPDFSPKSILNVLKHTFDAIEKNRFGFILNSHNFDFFFRLCLHAFFLNMRTKKCCVEAVEKEKNSARKSIYSNADNAIGIAYFMA